MAATSPPTRATAAEPDLVGQMFASSSVAVHLVRGVLGLALLIGSLVLADGHPWALLGLVGTLLAWRGCPTCWVMGLMATASRDRAGCSTGRCG